MNIVKHLICFLLSVFLMTAAVAEVPMHGPFSKYRSNGKYGLIDENQRIVVPAEYDEIQYNGMYLCKIKNGEGHVFDENGEQIHTFSAGHKKLTLCYPNVFFYETNGVRFLCDLSDNRDFAVRENAFLEENIPTELWIAARNSYYSHELAEVSEIYSCVYPFRNNRAVVLYKKYEGQIIDENFDLVAGRIFAAADYYSEGLIPVLFYGEGEFWDKETEKINTAACCYLDINGDVVYTCDFEFRWYGRSIIKQVQVPEIIGSFHEGVAVVSAIKNEWFVLDRNFNKHYLPEGYQVATTVIEDEWTEHLNPEPAYSNGLLLVSKTTGKSKRYGFADKNCNIAIPCEYTYAEPFDGPYAIVQKSGVDGVIDAAGKFTPVSEFLLAR